ncbi:sulfurtransferase [Bacillus timonensis]|nr:sulfurtransferase [Bacillus timonensis]
MIYIILLSVFIMISVFLYKRYFPVTGVKCLELPTQLEDNVVIVDLRDYQVGTKKPINGALHLPYAYLNRYYKEIPGENIHIVASDILERNLGFRFLISKGYNIRSYSLQNCECPKG